MGTTISNLCVNRLANPLGFDLGETPRLNWVVETSAPACDVQTRVLVALDVALENTVFDSGFQHDINAVCYEPKLPPLQPETRYYWQVQMHMPGQDPACSDVAWFETAKLSNPWLARWISPDFPEDRHPVLFTDFSIKAPVRSARIYVCGLGLYEASLNGDKVGDEFLSPGLCAYDKWLPYQTYDVSAMLAHGSNHLEVILGNGWYKGRYGLKRKEEFHYGETFSLILELHITYADGTKDIIITDKHWKAKFGKVLCSGIFDGEQADARVGGEAVYPVVYTEIDTGLLQARKSPPTRAMLTLQPVDVIHTPAGETVLDMGQNMVGFFSFYCTAPAGTTLHLQFGEVLQNGNFYRDNLRTAKAEYLYVSDGTPRWVRQHFTFYGFRYVKLTQWTGEVTPDLFMGMVLYSDMSETGQIETGNPKVNKLFSNTLWGQRGNYLDVPTDCPQRDERMGWTGDAQVFFGTAAFNMDVAAFFNKFLFDMRQEQKALDGWIPVVVPKHDVHQVGACAWGDAATILPWQLYVRYGDIRQLREHYPLMKDWVNAIRTHDEQTGATRLWKGSFHYGDWLSLDVEDPVGYRFGGTERSFLATCFYFYSTSLLVKAAKVLGFAEEAETYQTLADEIQAAFLREYTTNSGRLAETTQTAYVLSLYVGILPEEYRAQAAYALRLKLKASNYHLRTGFIGTPYLCRVLSATGSNDIAYRLLLQEDFPSWLYEVNMGATTIWERWNSILPDGSISDTGMNSLNHYSYGSIVEWMYRDVCGIQPLEDTPGFRRFVLAPKPDPSLGFARAVFHSPAGRIESDWRYEDKQLHYRFLVPFSTSASLVLPDEEPVELAAGEHRFTRKAIEPALGLKTPISQILQIEHAKQALTTVLPELPAMMLFDMMAGERSLEDLINEGFLLESDPRLAELLKQWNTN